jgi:predicted dehydrogenase
MEAIMAPHQPRFALLRQAMGRIGHITAAEFNFSQLSSKYPAFLRGENPNIFNPAMCAGALMDIGVYDVYLAAALFGAPDRVTAAAKFLPGASDSLGYAILTYPWGICSLNWSKVSQSRVASEILGDQGTITFAPASRLLDMTLWHPDGSSEVLFTQESHAASMSHEAADFVRYILHPQETAEEYAEMLQTSLLVSNLMAEIRKQCHIQFYSE